jgi:hypothetical protein
MNFPEYAIDVIKHEVGHWIVANRLGFKTGDITIRIVQEGHSFGHDASANIRPEPDVTNITGLLEYLENRICILFAGVISQVIEKKNITKSTAADLLSTNGASDYQKIIELVFICRGIRFSGKITEENELIHRNAITSEYWKKADELVQNNKDSIAFISQKIARIVVQPGKTYTIRKAKLASWISNFTA